MSLQISTIKTGVAAIGIAAAGIFGAAAASAAPAVQPFGHTAEYTSANGAQVIGYTVKSLQPSGNNDGVWFADVTVRADKGSATPIIGNFKARAANGAVYPVMEGPQPGGLSNNAIAPGAQTNGRIYFQVGLGTPPDSVVYSERAGTGADQLIWKM